MYLSHFHFFMNKIWEVLQSEILDLEQRLEIRRVRSAVRNWKKRMFMPIDVCAIVWNRMKKNKIRNYFFWEMIFFFFKYNDFTGLEILLHARTSYNFRNKISLLSESHTSVRSTKKVQQLSLFIINFFGSILNIWSMSVCFFQKSLGKVILFYVSMSKFNFG